MKKLLLSALMALSIFTAFAQTQTKDGQWKEGKSKKSRKERPIAPFYIGVSLGINNPAGIGLDLNYYVVPHVVLGAGIGDGTWGTKLHFDVKYMLKPYRPTWAFGAGITRTLAMNNYSTTAITDDGYGNSVQGDVTVNLHPMTNLFIAAYKYWNLGHRSNKCFLEAGYSIRLTDVAYDQVSGNPINFDGDKVMQLLAPGGVMVGFGFTFGLGKPREMH